MEEYKKLINEKTDNIKNDKGIYERIIKLYPNKDINAFMIDYNKFIENIDSDNNFKDGNCNINNCDCIIRGYRNLNKLDFF